VGDAELVDVAVEGVGDAAHVVRDVANGIGRFAAISTSRTS
jgi:hypothetical protein